MKKLTFVDIAIIVIAFFSLIVASPFVLRQFLPLHKVGDIIWNLSLDIVIVTIVALVLYAIDRLLNRVL